ncbi:MAG TPA: hypothetical protein VH877_09345 [Polyangia bacterium]|jgi:hypothetical protein|nr:hypothetical protein [Polyangia bacterium]
MDQRTEEQVGEAINEVLKHMEDWPYEKLADGFRAIQERFNWLAASAPAAFREVERRVAEDTLLAAEVKERSIMECESLLERVLELGWSDRYRAPEVLLPFGRYCIDQGRPDLARRYLKPVAAELAAIPPASGEEQLHGNLLAAVRKMLDGLSEC